MNNSNNINFLLKKKKITQVQIAKKCNVTPGMVNHVIHRRFKSCHIMATVADAVGKPVSELWPDKSKRKAA